MNIGLQNYNSNKSSGIEGSHQEKNFIENQTRNIITLTKKPEALE